MRRCAAWRRTEVMNAADYKSRASIPRHPLVDCRLFWRCFFALDMMHILDCKGLAATIFGSLLAMLVRDARLGANQAARMKTINAKMSAWHAARPGPHKLPSLGLPNITGSGGWHELT